MLENDFPIIDYSIIDSLDSLYIESRYPAGLGYLPYGQPSPEEAKVFFSFAQEVFAKACAITGNDIPGQLFKWKV